MGRVPEQLALLFPSSWGGRRRGAGRKPRTGQGQMPHAPRPLHCGRHPVHVTLRSAFRSLRCQFVFPTVRAAIAKTSARRGSTFRIIHFSVQYNHIHLIVEADDTAALVAGVRGLSISIAKRVNRLTFRRGRFWSDRWHGRALTTPRATRHALVYVLGNGNKHGSHTQSDGLDPCSSAPYFTEFRESAGLPPVARNARIVPRSLAPPARSPVSEASTWLLRVGWRKHGLISIHEAPAGRNHRVRHVRVERRQRTPGT
jgi:REP element-mobilizing transposase RayT